MPTCQCRMPTVQCSMPTCQRTVQHAYLSMLSVQHAYLSGQPAYLEALPAPRAVLGAYLVMLYGVQCPLVAVRRGVLGQRGQQLQDLLLHPDILGVQPWGRNIQHRHLIQHKPSSLNTTQTIVTQYNTNHRHLIQHKPSSLSRIHNIVT